MYNSKLLNLVLKLNKEELSTFDLYLKSPYFVKAKQQAELRKLFTLILKNIRKNKVEELEKKSVYQSIYGKEAVVKGKLEKLMSAMLQHIVYFISVYSAKEEEAAALLRVAQFYRNRLELKSYSKTLYKGGKLLDQMNDNNPDHLFQKFLFDKEAYQNQVLLHGSPKDYQFYNQLFSLDAFYLLQ